PRVLHPVKCWYQLFSSIRRLRAISPSACCHHTPLRIYPWVPDRLLLPVPIFFHRTPMYPAAGLHHCILHTIQLFFLGDHTPFQNEIFLPALLFLVQSMYFRLTTRWSCPFFFRCFLRHT